MRQATKLLGALVAERIKIFEESGGDWPDKPVKISSPSYLINMNQKRVVAPGSGPAPPTHHVRSYQTHTHRDHGCYPHVFDRMLRTSSAIKYSWLTEVLQTFVHALFDLAANPSYIQPLREEVEVVVDIRSQEFGDISDQSSRNHNVVGMLNGQLYIFGFSTCGPS